ncbi:signal peptidase I [Spongisporangium articulatum]|uniref:Signal peptidase I n=1 Tax=Spongisporangium articulatum TaxID=3362603 RepID=A0ABW8APM0_9ACTN
MLRRFVVAELSMSPALQPGQEIDAEPASAPGRGVVLFFADPTQDDFWLVKRVVGLPGETVTIADGEVRLDGRPYDDPWTFDHTEPPGEWHVPPGHVFVLSDARGRSLADSRTFGPVPVAGAYQPVG